MSDGAGRSPSYRIMLQGYGHMKGWKKTGPSTWEPDPVTATDYSDKIGHVILFTNVDGDTHCGVIIESHASGLVRVFFDDFVALRRRIGRADDGVTDAGRFWIRPDQARPGTRYDIYPPSDIDVRWHNVELRAWSVGDGASSR